MVDRTEPTFDAVEQALRDAGVLSETAEIHGELCARLCLLGEEAGRPWVADVLGDTSAPDAAILLEALAARTSCSLEAGDMSLSLLLPGDEDALQRRVEGLGLWCQGFLHGLGADAARNENPWILKNTTAREIIDDFSQITLGAVGGDETEAQGEAAFVELVEYVRVSVQLVFEELNTGRSAPAKPVTH